MDGMHPTKKEIEKDLGIHVYTYFKNMVVLYETSGIDINAYHKSLRESSNPFNSDEKNEENTSSILDFIRSNVKEGFYPSTIHIQRELKLKFYKYFENIYEAYKKAGVEYDRPSPIILGKNKERVFTHIILNLLVELGYKMERVSIYDRNSFNKGEDLRISDNKANVYLVELKAYRCDYRVTPREIRQLQRYLKNQKVRKGILITTSDKVSRMPDNIKCIKGKELISLLKKNYLSNALNQIKWIQEERVNLIEREKEHSRKKKEIIGYVTSCKTIPSQRQIERSLRVSLKTYFEKPPYRNLMLDVKKINSGSAQA